MGNNPSSYNKIKFGSINDPKNSRPGYYANGKILKYHTSEIILLLDENLESFKKLKYGYAITNKRVFYKGIPINNINPANFDIINIKNVKVLNDIQLVKLNSVLGIEITLQDKKNIYHKGHLFKTI